MTVDLRFFFFLFFPQDKKVHLYSIQGNTLKEECEPLELKGRVTDLAYSNNGAYLAVIDENKAATVYTVADNYSVNIFLCSIDTLCFLFFFFF